MKRIVIESPYAGNVERNLAYVRWCMGFALERGCAPFASHALYTQPGVLDDGVPGQRKLGIEAGYEYWEAAAEIWFCIDLGWSNGMYAALAHLRRIGRVTSGRLRVMGAPWSTNPPSEVFVMA